jgi:hypothetical protein
MLRFVVWHNPATNQYLVLDKDKATTNHPSSGGFVCRYGERALAEEHVGLLNRGLSASSSCQESAIYAAHRHSGLCIEANCCRQPPERSTRHE